MSLHFDVDGTLTNVGQKIEPRAVKLIEEAKVVFGGAVSCNTEQCT
jgi:hydroxymethylpyrimidine pyrophosphatase-like HAD family hydrolase